MVAHPLRCRGAGLDAGLGHHPAPLPQGLSAAGRSRVRLRGAIGFAVALVVAPRAPGSGSAATRACCRASPATAFVEEPGGLSGEAAEIARRNYWRKTGPTELGNASLQGMVSELRRRHHDRFTEYFSPENLEGFNQQIEGRFSGIGLSVAPKSSAGCGSIEVFPRSPAAEAGIVAGELIVSVDGESIAGETSTEATKKIKGPEGTRGDGRRPRPEDEEDAGSRR